MKKAALICCGATTADVCWSCSGRQDPVDHPPPGSEPWVENTKYKLCSMYTYTYKLHMQILLLTYIIALVYSITYVLITKEYLSI